MKIFIIITITCLIFFSMCYLGTGSDEKNIKSYASYPDSIQKIIHSNEQLNEKIKTISPIIAFLSNVFLFAIVFLITGYLIKETGFKRNFGNILIMGEILNAFDFIIIDMLWWRNSKRVRFSGTENMIEEYKNSKKHFISFIKGIFVFLIVAIIDGIVLAII
ncbi:hypothetical protein KTC96_24275 (plasmid) [Clostridium estertheticum]|uniref:hypothetical protein n=1 Tax=Clostridium estertheticum TaxID=238834 RepID=UPI001C7D77C1|nr:hypothetical protein [Clostridium estertheticum]MBX4262905.1 hypothetical protein [Clostridium estertheticum]WLC72793.1 hypothetical protein KTC96_23125 [Clostridium estertheticum]WLC72868.1 hypothetical protein KTC96_23550 [Clostridium estertheticum]WLC73104.1 hypothetical protein KTC96_24275 [Clostridium estertheticum]